VVKAKIHEYTVETDIGLMTLASDTQLASNLQPCVKILAVRL